MADGYTTYTAHMDDADANLMLRDVLDSMLEGFMIVGYDSRILYVNETSAKFSKQSKSSLLGRTIEECFPGSESTELYRATQKCMKERVSVKVEGEYDFPQGSAAVFQLYIHPAKDGIVILSIDITEQKIMEGVLVKKVDELEKLASVSLDREIRIADLKKQVAELKEMVVARNK